MHVVQMAMLVFSVDFSCSDAPSWVSPPSRVSPSGVPRARTHPDLSICFSTDDTNMKHAKLERRRLRRRF